MEPVTPRGRGYYATRATVRAAVMAAIVTAFFALPGTIERGADALIAGLGL